MRRFLVNSCSQCSSHNLLRSLGREVFSLPYFSSKLHVVVLCIEEVRKNCVPAAENVAQSQSGIDRRREGAFLSNEVS